MKKSWILILIVIGIISIVSAGILILKRTVLSGKSGGSQFYGTVYDTLRYRGKNYFFDSVTIKEFNRFPPREHSVLDEKDSSYWTRIRQYSNQLVIRDSMEVKIKGEEIVFNLKNGETVKLENKEDTVEFDNSQNYLYLGMNKEIDCWLIYALYYEGWGFLMIDRRTGKTNHVYGMPLFSPSKKYFICYSIDIFAGYGPNGIQIWRNDENSPKMLFEKEFDDWGPEEVRWSGDTMLYFKQGYWKERANGLSYRYAKLRLPEF